LRVEIQKHIFIARIAAEVRTLDCDVCANPRNKHGNYHANDRRGCRAIKSMRNVRANNDYERRNSNCDDDGRVASKNAWNEGVEDQNEAVNEPESKEVEPPIEPEVIEEAIPEPIQVPHDESALAPQTSATPRTQSLAQQEDRGFIKSLLIKAQAKIQFNKQKKLDKMIQLAQKKQIITNDDVQKLLYVSDATATRYLVKLVEQGRLSRIGSPRDAKYQFLR